MVELFAGASLATRLVPRLSGRVSRPRATIWVLFHLLCRLVMLLVRLLQDGQRYAHVLRERGTALVELHHTTTGVVLAMPNDLAGRRRECQGRVQVHGAYVRRDLRPLGGRALPGVLRRRGRGAEPGRVDAADHRGLQRPLAHRAVLARAWSLRRGCGRERLDVVDACRLQRGQRDFALPARARGTGRRTRHRRPRCAGVCGL
mmetsp:Transcript_29623/g.74627  ORF Transcript_29623/g.74627 Transcript_29623/m.74627 type:complete len:203 (-) Transcript_29623:310-918(-)